jgi:hypothetical protein
MLAFRHLVEPDDRVDVLFAVSPRLIRANEAKVVVAPRARA